MQVEITEDEVGIKFKDKEHKFTVISCKCPRCSLLFKLYTENPDKWRKKNQGFILGATCPECANGLVYALAWAEKHGHIFDDCPELSDTDKKALRDPIAFKRELMKFTDKTSEVINDKTKKSAGEDIF